MSYWLDWRNPEPQGYLTGVKHVGPYKLTTKNCFWSILVLMEVVTCNRRYMELRTIAYFYMIFSPNSPRQLQETTDFQLQNVGTALPDMLIITDFVRISHGTFMDGSEGI